MSQERDDALIARLMSEFRKRVGWRTFTPVLYQNGVIAHTVGEAIYYADDAKVHVSCSVTATAPGSVGTVVSIILPTFLAPNNYGTPLPLGNFVVWDKSVGWYHGFAHTAGPLSGGYAIHGTVHNAGNHIGVSPNFAIASADEVAINITYRLA